LSFSKGSRVFYEFVTERTTVLNISKWYEISHFKYDNEFRFQNVFDLPHACFTSNVVEGDEIATVSKKHMPGLKQKTRQCPIMDRYFL